MKSTSSEDEFDELDQAIARFAEGEYEEARNRLYCFCIKERSLVQMEEMLSDHASWLKERPMCYERFAATFYEISGNVVSIRNPRKARVCWKKAVDLYSSVARSFEAHGIVVDIREVYYSLVDCLIRISGFMEAKDWIRRYLTHVFAFITYEEEDSTFHGAVLSTIAYCYEMLSWCCLWLGEKKTQVYHDKAYRILSFVMHSRKPLLAIKKAKIDGDLSQLHPFVTLTNLVTNLELLERDKVRIGKQHISAELEFVRLIIESLKKVGLKEDAFLGGWFEDLILCNWRLGRKSEARKAAAEVSAYLDKSARNKDNVIEAAALLIGAGEFNQLAGNDDCALQYYKRAFALAPLDTLLRSQDDIEIFATFASRAAGILALHEEHSESTILYDISAAVYKQLLAIPYHYYNKGLSLFESSLAEWYDKRFSAAIDSLKRAKLYFQKAERSAHGSISERELLKAARFRRNMCIAFDELFRALYLRSEGLKTLDTDLIDQAKVLLISSHKRFAEFSLFHRLSNRERHLLRFYSSIANVQSVVSEMAKVLCVQSDVAQVQNTLRRVLHMIARLCELAEKTKRKKLLTWLRGIEFDIRNLSGENERLEAQALVQLVLGACTQVPFSSPAPTCEVTDVPQNLVGIRILHHPQEIQLDRTAKITLELRKIAAPRRALQGCPLYIEYSIPDIGFSAISMSSLPYIRSTVLKFNMNITSENVDIIKGKVLAVRLRPMLLIGGSCFRGVGDDVSFSAKITCSEPRTGYQVAKDFIRNLEIGFDTTEFSKERNAYLDKFEKIHVPHSKLTNAFESLLQRISKSFQVTLHGTKEYSGIDISKKLGDAVLGFQIKCRDDNITEDRIRAQTSKALEYNIDGFVLVYALRNSGKVSTSIQGAYHHFRRTNRVRKMYCSLIPPETLAELFRKYDVVI